MADTFNQTCTKCKYEADCVEGICGACDAGEFFCGCGNEISEHMMDTVGVCEECM